MKNNKKFFKKNSPWLSVLALTVMTGALLLSGCGTNATAPNNGGPTTAPASSTQPAGQDSGSGNGNGNSNASGNGSGDNSQTPATWNTGSTGNSGSSDNGNGGTGTAPSNSTTPPSSGSSIDTTHNNYHGTSVYFQNSTTGFVGGDEFILRSTDGGKTWNQQWHGPSTIDNFTFPTATTGYFLGNKSGVNPPLYTVYKTTDGGQTWKLSNEIGQINGPIHFTSAQVGFIGNRMTSDGAQTWKTLPIPSNTQYGGVYFDDANNGYAVTADNNGFQIVRTTDGGQHWKTTLSKGGFVTRADIDSTSPDDAWVLLYGGSGMTQTSYSLFHTADGGQTWTTVVNTVTAGGGPAPGFPNETTGRNGPAIAPGPVQALDSQTAYLLGVCHACNGLGTNSIGYTKDGGKTWTNNSAQWPGQDAELSFVDQNHGWVLANARGFGSVLYETSDGGKTWGQEFVFGKSGPPGE